MSPSEKKYGLRDSDISAIQNIFNSCSNLKKAILYGSRAKGNYRPGSDIDLCLQGELLTYYDLVVIENALDDLLLPYTIDLSIYEKIDNPHFLEHVNRVGIDFFVKKLD